VRHAVYGQRVKPWVAGNHFPRRTRGGVFDADGGDVFADVCEHGVSMLVVYFVCFKNSSFPHDFSGNPANAIAFD
jgi:hypothetical protein